MAAPLQMRTNCLVLAVSTLPPECQRNNTSTHLESAFTSHRGAAASLLDQSEVHGRSDAAGKPTAWSWRQALFPRVPSAKQYEHAP